MRSHLCEDEIVSVDHFGRVEWRLTATPFPSVGLHGLSIVTRESSPQLGAVGTDQTDGRADPELTVDPNNPDGQQTPPLLSQSIDWREL